MSRYIVKATNLELPKHLIIWDGGSTKLQLHIPTISRTKFIFLLDYSNCFYPVNSLAVFVTTAI